MSGLGLFLGTSLSVLALQYSKCGAKLQKECDENAVVSVSAPGKILIAGGYLVLESPNIGVTIATTSRFFTSIKWERFTKSEDSEHVHIVVSSPQFHSAYNYLYNDTDDTLINLGASSNTFVEKCIILSFAFVKQCLGQKAFTDFLRSYIGGQLHMKLRADNDFYSQIKELKKRQQPLLSSSLFRLEKFLPCPIDERGNVEIAKTGLGSSAALTTSLVAAILQWFGIVKLGMRIAEEDRRIVHNLAQLVHANAQGKIGSGFDVAAAVYGTQTYSRFSSSAFNACLEDTVPADVLYRAVMNTNPSEGWSQAISPFKLPPGLVVVLGDVCGGSSSTSMAREVLKWKKDKPDESAVVWNKLAETNAQIAIVFEKLNKYQAVDSFQYNSSIHWASNHNATAWSTKNDDKTIQLLVELKSLFTTARSHLKRMGELAGVEIEPESQTKLANATETIDGVVTALVPGAGGVDALVALALSDAARMKVEKMWSEWHTTSGESLYVCPLTLKAESGLATGVNLCTLDWE